MKPVSKDNHQPDKTRQNKLHTARSYANGHKKFLVSKQWLGIIAKFWELFFHFLISRTNTTILNLNIIILNHSSYRSWENICTNNIWNWRNIDCLQPFMVNTTSEMAHTHLTGGRKIEREHIYLLRLTISTPNGSHNDMSGLRSIAINNCGFHLLQDDANWK